MKSPFKREEFEVALKWFLEAPESSSGDENPRYVEVISEALRRAASPTPPAGEGAVEIRKNTDGTIDEIVAHDCSVHVEQMSADGWYMGIEFKNGSYSQFWFGSKNRKSAVEFQHTETSERTPSGEQPPYPPYASRRIAELVLSEEWLMLVEGMDRDRARAIHAALEADTELQRSPPGLGVIGETEANVRRLVDVIGAKRHDLSFAECENIAREVLQELTGADKRDSLIVELVVALEEARSKIIAIDTLKRIDALLTKAKATMIYSEWPRNPRGPA